MALFHSFNKLQIKDSTLKYGVRYLKLDSIDIDIIKKVAELSFETKKYDQALYHFKKIDYDSTDSDLNYKLGVCMVYSGKSKKAVPFFEKISETNFNFKQAQYYIKKYSSKNTIQ